MVHDMNGDTLEVGDWITVPDDWYPWELGGSFIYGSQCRLAEVTEVYTPSGNVYVRMHKMRDLRHLENSNPFHYAVTILGTEVTRALTAEQYENRGASAPVTPHVSNEQPRDAAGRFTSPNRTTIRLSGPADVAIAQQWLVGVERRTA